MEIKDLVQMASDRKYSDFNDSAKEMLMKKVAENPKMVDLDGKLDSAHNVDSIEEASGDKAAYKKFFDGKLKKFKVDSPDDLSDEDKKKFFAEIEDEWDSKDEE